MIWHALQREELDIRSTITEKYFAKMTQWVGNVISTRITCRISLAFMELFRIRMNHLILIIMFLVSMNNRFFKCFAYIVTQITDYFISDAYFHYNRRLNI